MIKPYAKAVIALLGALATWGITASEDDRYTQVELWGGLLALVTAAGVYFWPNRPATGRARRADLSEQAPDAGHGSTDLLWFVAGAGALALVLLAFGRL